MRLVDLTQPMSIHTPGWVGYPSIKLWYWQQHHTNGIVSQIVEMPLHMGTHMDSEIHGVSGGGDISDIPLSKLCHEGVIVDLEEEAGHDWGIYTPDMIEKKVEVKEGDILVIHTGWHRYFSDQKQTDLNKYFLKHPGPTNEFAEWAVEKKLSWIGVDCGSADHSLNTSIRTKRPDMVVEFEKTTGKKLQDVLPDETVFCMHHKPFKNHVIHVENIGGDIEQVLNKRCMIGAFPWNFKGAEAGVCRVVAFLED